MIRKSISTTFMLALALVLANAANASLFPPKIQIDEPLYIWTFNGQRFTGGPTDCVAGSGRDSRVSSWPCVDLDRYQWKIVPSGETGWFYIVNAGNEKCLSRHSRKNRIRQYGFSEKPCKKSEFRKWRFLDHNNDIIHPQDIVVGSAVKIQSRHLKAGCLSRKGDSLHVPVFESALRTRDCDQEQEGNVRIDNFFIIGGNPLSTILYP